MPFAQRKDSLGRVASFLRGHGYALEKESQPSFPVSTPTDSHQAVVVLRAMELEVVAQVEQRPAQDPCPNEQKRDEQAPDAAIAVQKRVDRFELRVCQADLDELRTAGIRSEEHTSELQSLRHLVCR